MKIILQKFIASSGYCSRRKAEELIRTGVVKVNGERAELGMRVSDDDEVTIKNKKINAGTKKKYIIMNKPVGYVCTNKKFVGEKNVFDLLKNKQRLIISGRLDKESEGLILLTNDGELVNRLTHPRFDHEKKYLVWTDAKEEYSLKNFYKKMRYGVDIGDGDGVVKAKKVDQNKDGSFEVILTEGKKRQLRRMFEKLGLRVLRLQRIEMGILTLGKLRVGEWRELTKDETDKLTTHNA